jgi:NTP pyrophosphatase (non-canonical NTP hydrolase)
MGLPISKEDRLMDEIWEELATARARFPAPNLNMCALTEEVGELAQALLHTKFGGRCGGWANVRKEAIQVATMAIRVALEGDSSIAEPGD